MIQHTIMQKIKEYNTIIIHRHNNPDGDAIGSQIGLKEAILATFPKKKVYVVGDETERFKFIGQMDEIDDSNYDNALVFILDTAEVKMISDDRWQKAKYIIRMDHHIHKEAYGNIEVIDANEISTASIVSRFIFTMGLKLTKKGAEALFTGIVTDSGRFRYGTNLKSTFDVCTKLFKYDIDTQSIYSNLYIEDWKMVELRAKLTLKIKFDGNIAYIINTHKDVLEYEQPLFNISRGMVSIMAGIRGIDKWANFTEDEDGKVIVELRSSKYNVNSVAVAFGGGGHRLASGATLSSLSEVDKVLEALKGVNE